MKTRIMLGALIMAVVIGTSVGVGYAGSGDGGLTGVAIFYHCYQINGEKPGGTPSSNSQEPPPLVLTVNDELDNSHTGYDVNVGNAQLLCIQSSAKVKQGSIVAEFPASDFDQVTCYKAPGG